MRSGGSAGRVLLDGARRTLAEADWAVAGARNAAAGELGQVKVAFSWSARLATLPTLGQAFGSRYPDVQLITQEMWNTDMESALHSGAVDVAISLCPELPPDIADEVIRTESVVAILAAKHPRQRGSDLARGAWRTTSSCYSLASWRLDSTTSWWVSAVTRA